MGFKEEEDDRNTVMRETDRNRQSREKKSRRWIFRISSDLLHFCVETTETREAVIELSYQILYFWETETLCLVQQTSCTLTDHGDISSITSQSADC